MSFKKAERKQAKLKLAITGPSGSGKTYSALRLAKGLGGKIAFIDTENGSASLYSDRFEFDVLELNPPYTNERYLQALEAAVTGKYDIVIIDSLTHQWAGEGGLLNKKEQMDARGGNSYTNWAKMTPEHEKFKAAILHSDIHVIGTMRSKMDYVMETNDKGKQAPKKVGLAPIQRDGMEYEFTTVFDVAMNHEAEASKDRTGLFTGKIFQITEKTGEEIGTWLKGGKKVVVQTPTGGTATNGGSAPPISSAPSTESPSADAGSTPPEWKASKEDLERLNQTATAPNEHRQTPWLAKGVTSYMKTRFQKDRLGEFNKEEFDQLLGTVRSKTFSQAMAELGPQHELDWEPGASG